MTMTTPMQPPLLQLIVVSFYLPPPPDFWPTRLNNRDVNNAPTPSPIRPSDIHAGPWCLMTTLPHSSSSSSPLCSGSFAKDDEGELLSWPPSLFAIALSVAIASVLMMQMAFVHHMAAHHTKKTSQCMPAFPQTTWPAAPCSCCIIMHWRR
jgi:hypothetical protein